MMRGRGSKLMKRLDRYIGIPVLYLLGKCRHKQDFPQDIGDTPRIAVIKTAAIGDTVLVSAMVRELHEAYPQSHITVICASNNVAMVKLLPYVDEILVFDIKSPVRALLAVHRLPEFDFVFDFGPWPRINGVITWALRAKFKVGFKRHNMYRHYCYDATAEHLDSLHEIENYRQVLKAGYIAPQGLLPSFHTDEPPVLSGRYAVFHLYPGGAMQLQREWPLDNWLSLARILHEQYGLTICVSGGREDAFHAAKLVQQMQDKGISAKVLAGRYNLGQMINILQYAQLLVSVNTGIMHLGAATDTPMVALHGATSIQRWGPLNRRAVAINSGEPCQPCISLGFESDCPDPVCMRHITVEQVMQAIDSLLLGQDGQHTNEAGNGWTKK